jgi:hypothetical protein
VEGDHSMSLKKSVQVVDMESPLEKEVIPGKKNK